MNEQQARSFLKFLARSEVKGFELEEFAAVVNHCRAILAEAEQRKTQSSAFTPLDA